MTLSADLPFTFVDHALRHGDSLVGLDLEQIASFHWKPTEQVPLLRQVLEDALDEALEHRAELLELAKDDSPRSQEEAGQANAAGKRKKATTRTPKTPKRPTSGDGGGQNDLF